MVSFPVNLKASVNTGHMIRVYVDNVHPDPGGIKSLFLQKQNKTLYFNEQAASASSFADPGCLFRIRKFFISDPT
jgi:hypothetical protein